jgi:hypothetical protein
VTAAARPPGTAPGTLPRRLGDGFVAGGQVTPACPGGSTSPTRLAAHHPTPETCQARRAASRPHPYRTQERLTYQHLQRAQHPVLTMRPRRHRTTWALNRQGRRTAPGKLSYPPNKVQSPRHYWHTPGHQPTDRPQKGGPLTVTAAARQLGTAPRTLPRRPGDGFVVGGQVTPACPGGSTSPTSYAARSSTTPRRLGRRALRHPCPGRVPNSVAMCQARRAASRPHPHRTPERLTYQRFQPYRHLFRS